MIFDCKHDAHVRTQSLVANLAALSDQLYTLTQIVNRTNILVTHITRFTPNWFLLNIRIFFLHQQQIASFEISSVLLNVLIRMFRETIFKSAPSTMIMFHLI
jgi:hypothetical protein